VGLAAVRDAVSFFRYEAQDGQGTHNPIAGQVQHTIGLGISQSGNLVRTFLNLGFNEDEQGRRVWDGAMPIIAARQTPLNLRFAVPGGASNLYEPGSDGTVWWADWQDSVRGQPARGLLSRCRATNTCPKVMEVMGSSEFYALRASPDYVGTSGKADIPLPENVRRYYVASTQHGGGPGGFHSAAMEARRPATAGPIEQQPCALPPNPNPMADVNRALLDRLHAWVVRDEAPPASVYPKIADGSLIPESELARRFPFIPGVPSPEGIANPTLFYDFGPGFRAADVSGYISLEPPQVTGVLPTYLPAIDADGNEVAGVRTVLAQAPLGSYLGWNVFASGFDKGKFCSLTGSYVPFAETKQERLAEHDSRLSLEERYGTHEGYVNQVRSATARLVKAGFLLPDDAAKLLDEAKHSDVLRKVAMHE
jgi:Alpha/beta hydrolase domain